MSPIERITAEVDAYVDALLAVIAIDAIALAMIWL